MKDINLKYFYEWPVFARAIIIAICCAILAYLGYFLDFSNLRKQLDSLQQQELDLKTQFVSLFNNEIELQTELKKTPTFIAALNQIQKKLISPAELSELLNEILKKGTQDGLVFNGFTPDNPIPTNTYIEIPIKAILLGSYDQISNFISQVGNMDQMVSIGNFTISRESAAVNAEQNALSDRLKAEVTLKVYEAKKP